MASFASFDVAQIWACRFPAKNSSRAKYRGRRFAVPPSTMGFALRAGFKANIATRQGFKVPKERRNAPNRDEARHTSEISRCWKKDDLGHTLVKGS